MVPILRQELDSMVRVIFLLSLKDREYRGKLIEDAVAGKKWTHPNTRKAITDREMVNLANYLHGWSKSVYSFGCAFIHLSNLHDHKSRDPLGQISEADRTAMLKHLRQYHGGPAGDSPTFNDVTPFLPMVFQKIADNLECYVDRIEKDENLDD